MHFSPALSICRNARLTPRTPGSRLFPNWRRGSLRSQPSFAAMVCGSNVSTASVWNGTQDKTDYHVEENDPLSAVAELHHTQTMSRNEWQIRIETQLRLSCTGNAFLLQGSLRAFEGANEVCHRDWDRSVPRDFS